MIKFTGTKITDEQHTELLKLQHEVQHTPCVKVHGTWLHEAALEDFKRKVDEFAQANGLPAPGKIDGDINHYGVDSKRREFTTYDATQPTS